MHLASFLPRAYATVSADIGHRTGPAPGRFGNPPTPVTGVPDSTRAAVDMVPEQILRPSTLSASNQVVYTMEAEFIEDRILSILEADCRMSLEEIADEVGVSKPTARKYISKLESDGVIVDYSAEVDPKKLNHQSLALVGIDVESVRYVEATAALQELDSLRALYTATGDHTLMAELRAGDSDELNRIISNQILDIDGVTTACPAILQERLK